MEIYSHPIMELLTKFSHCINILQYYGFNQECRTLMSQLCKASFKIWEDNKTPFANWIQLWRKKLIYFREFDEEFRHFLEQNNRFERYELIFNVKGVTYQFDQKSKECNRSSLFYSIDKFLNKVEWNSKTKFDKIYIILKYGFIHDFNLLISKHPLIKKYCLFTGNLRHIKGKPHFVNPLSWNNASIWELEQDNNIETNVFNFK